MAGAPSQTHVIMPNSAKDHLCGKELLTKPLLRSKWNQACET